MKMLLSFGLFGAASAAKGGFSAADVTVEELAKLTSFDKSFTLELPKTVCTTPVTESDCQKAALAISGGKAYKSEKPWVMFSNSKPKGCSVKMHPTKSEDWSNNQVFFSVIGAFARGSFASKYCFHCSASHLSALQAEHFVPPSTFLRRRLLLANTMSN